MTQQELKTTLRQLDKEKENIIKRIETDFKKKKEDLLDAWAREHARFKAGDIINSMDGDNFNCERGTYLRIETVTTDLSDTIKSPFIRYTGKLLLPDLTENPTRCKYNIRDYSNNRITRLTQPEFTSYVVTDESDDHEFTAKSYLDALDKVRHVCHDLEQNAETYGVTPKGKRVLLLKTPTLAKYFKNK